MFGEVNLAAVNKESGDCESGLPARRDALPSAPQTLLHGQELRRRHRVALVGGRDQRPGETLRAVSSISRLSRALRSP